MNNLVFFLLTLQRYDVFSRRPINSVHFAVKIVQKCKKVEFIERNKCIMKNKECRIKNDVS